MAWKLPVSDVPVLLADRQQAFAVHGIALHDHDAGHIAGGVFIGRRAYRDHAGGTTQGEKHIDFPKGVGPHLSVLEPTGFYPPDMAGGWNGLLHETVGQLGQQSGYIAPEPVYLAHAEYVFMISVQE